MEPVLQVQEEDAVTWGRMSLHIEGKPRSRDLNSLSWTPCLAEELPFRFSAGEKKQAF